MTHHEEPRVRDALRYISDRVAQMGRNTASSRSHPNGKIFMATMTDTQIRTCPEFVAGLKKQGFKLRNRWRNNSGEWCNLIVLESSKCGSALKDSPWNTKAGK
tara:strand:- start:26117 stop:26425 length:309 start_codon:yes stop_codon:yes gene_type:complete